MNRVLMILFLCGLGISCSNAEKSYKTNQNPPKISRSFGITPGYMERTFNSNESMKLLPLSLMQLSTKGFDAAIGAVDNVAAKWGVGLLGVAWHTAQAITGQVLYHEFGHARAFAALGGESYDYSVNSSRSNSPVKTQYAYGFYCQRLLNPWLLFSLSGATQYRSAITMKPGKFRNRLWNGFNVTLGDIISGVRVEDGYTSMAGNNNQMQYAQSIADVLFDQNGHFLYAVEYFVGKSTNFFYTRKYKSDLENGSMSIGNDIDSVLKAYEYRGLNIDASDIQVGSIASLLLSSTTWSFVYSGFTELPKGSFVVHAPVWKGWRLPDLNFFLTTQGLSYQIVTGYQWSPNWYTGLTTEFVYKGNTAWEVGPSIGYTFTPQGMGQFDLSAQLIVSNEGEFAGNAKAEWTAPGKNWRVGLHYIYHNAMTLVGERNIPFLSSGLMSGGEPSATNHELNLTVSYLY